MEKTTESALNQHLLHILNMYIRLSRHVIQFELHIRVSLFITINLQSSMHRMRSRLKISETLENWYERFFFLLFDQNRAQSVESSVFGISFIIDKLIRKSY